MTVGRRAQYCSVVLKTRVRLFRILFKILNFRAKRFFNCLIILTRCARCRIDKKLYVYYLTFNSSPRSICKGHNLLL